MVHIEKKEVIYGVKPYLFTLGLLFYVLDRNWIGVKWVKKF